MPQETGLEAKKARPCSSCLYWRTMKMKRSEEVSRGCDKVAHIRAEVDKFSKKVAALERVVYDGTKVVEKEFIVLTELLMRELLKLDGIEAVGETKVQRKMEVCRIQSLVDTLDTLKARNL